MEKNICIIDGKKKFALSMEKRNLHYRWKKEICIIDGKRNIITNTIFLYINFEPF
jgi:hypothetical protein